MLKKLISQSLLYQNLRSAYEYFGLPKKRRENQKINIVFLVFRTNVWNSLKSVYDAANKNANINTYLVALPPFYRGKTDLEDESVYEFCKSIDKEAIKAYDIKTKDYINLEKLNPDYIFIDIPYDYEYPEQYGTKKLACTAKLCYVSYGYTMKKSKLQKITARLNIMMYASYVFACNNTMYEFYRKRMLLTEFISGKRLYNIGFPRFDLYKNLSEGNKNNKTVMWLPRWTTETQVNKDGNEPSSFFEIKDKILDYFQRNPQYELVARPHPSAFRNYTRSGLMTESEVEEYKNRIKNSENMTLDTNPSYYENLIKTDILIADFTSILAEYFVTGRPIIYLGNSNNVPSEHKEMFNSFYNASSWEEAEKILNDLLIGKDYKKEQREQTVKSFMQDKPLNAGEHIVNILVNDYYNEERKRK